MMIQVTLLMLCCCMCSIKGQSLYDEIISKAAAIRSNGGPTPYGHSMQKVPGPGSFTGPQQLPNIGSRIPFTVTSTNHYNLAGRQSGLVDIDGNNGHMGSSIDEYQPMGGYSAGFTSGGTAPHYPFTTYNASPLVERGPFSSLFGSRLNNQRYPAPAYYSDGAFAVSSDDAFEQDDDYLQLGPSHRDVVSSNSPIYDSQSSSELDD
ncbi:uncharacterized protein LOC127841686 [Dreissena polymorpha]|uniref:Uncharacterized protein n=1 Tax=Dreissena polymorpha TaxID=45954 RepID=A0A9D4N1N5_DREPO|nr:uncharacterized protein LOC127841686 [Dreissena polymorpha]KAH3886106.1 hypothetical protein DPMN_010107 [Dreissena polymorpha]